MVKSTPGKTRVSRDDSFIRREIDRISQLHGEARSDAVMRLALRPETDQLIDRPPDYTELEGYWDIAFARWDQRVAEGGKFAELLACAGWLDEVHATQERAIFWAARMAWRHRGIIDPGGIPDAAQDEGSVAQIFNTTLICSQLRFLFKFHQLEQATTTPLRLWPTVEYFHSLNAFSLLGQNDARGQEQVARLWESVKDSDSPVKALSRRACIDALWVSQPNEPRMLLLRSFCHYVLDRYPGDDRDYISYYCLAFAHRHLAQHEEAMSAISHALERLRGDSVEFLNDQFLRERDLIMAEMRMESIRQDLLNVTSLLDEARNDVAAAEARLNDQISQQTIRLVEVLGLFSAIIAFVLGGYQIASSSKSLWSAVLLITVTGVASILFFGTVLLIERKVPRRR